jgi:hypothetical protein
MRNICFLLCTSLFIISCSRLPNIYPADGSAQRQLHKKCRQLFPTGNWQFFHIIEVIMPGGKKSVVTGLTVISSKDKTIRSVIMTIEGLVLFDARYDHRLIINRAISPFDSAEFAQGLIKDIQLIFFKPPGVLIGIGFLKNGYPVCRYQYPDGRINDIVSHPDGNWEVRQYSYELDLTRTVKSMSVQKLDSPHQSMIPGRIELTAHDSPGYVLVMNLVEAVELEQ